MQLRWPKQGWSNPNVLNLQWGSQLKWVCVQSISLLTTTISDAITPVLLASTPFSHPAPVTYSTTLMQSTDVQTGLPVSTTTILSTVTPSTLVLLMLVCTVVVILIVRWRITRKQVDTALEHTGKHINNYCGELVYSLSIFVLWEAVEERIHTATFREVIVNFWSCVSNKHS